MVTSYRWGVRALPLLVWGLAALMLVGQVDAMLVEPWPLSGWAAIGAAAAGWTVAQLSWAWWVDHRDSRAADVWTRRGYFWGFAIFAARAAYLLVDDAGAFEVTVTAWLAVGCFVAWLQEVKWQALRR